MAATVGFAVAFIGVTWPLVLRLGSSTYGGRGDGWALIWQTRFRFDNGVSYFTPTHSSDVAWPLGADITSSLLLSNAAVELPHLFLLLVGVGDVAAYNLITFAAALTSSLAMYLLIRRLGCRADVAFWGGLVYFLAPWHLEKIGIHPTLASMAALPLLVLGVVEWIRQPGLKSGALVVGAALLATYTHSYYGLAAAVLLLGSLVPVAVIAQRRGNLGLVLKRTALLGGVLVLVPLPLALALKLQSADVEMLIERPHHLIELAARPHLWLLPSTDNPVFGDMSRRYIESNALRANEGELALYLGLLTILLAATGLAVAAHTRARVVPTAIALTTAVVGVLLSMPGTVFLPLVGATKMPIAHVTEVFDFVSTPARFFALTLTGTVVLAALGLDWIARRLGNPWAFAAVALACLGSALELPFHRDGRVVGTDPPPIVRTIESMVPTEEAIAQYPSMPNFYKPIADQLFYQVGHRHPVMNGALAGLPEDAVRLAVDDETQRTTPGILSLVGARWATYEPDAAAEKERLIGTPEPDAYAYTPPKGFKVVRRLTDGSLLMRVTARPAPAFASLASGFSSSGRWLMRRRGTLLACATTAGQYTLRFNAGAFAQNRSIKIGGGRIISIVVAEVPIRTRVRLRAGWQFLAIKLIGSEPTRPSDVIPGEPDTRPLVVSIGPITATGPLGSPDRCRETPPEGEIPTVE